MSGDKTDLLLNELERINAKLDNVQRDGDARGKTTSATLTVITKEMQSMGGRLGSLETWRADLTQQIARKDSGFNRAVRNASETDAKHEADLAAVVTVVRSLGEQVARSQTQQTGALGNMIASGIKQLEPSTKKRIAEAVLMALFALSTLANTWLNSRAQPPQTIQVQTAPVTTIEGHP